jgi:hypothetical protein
MRPFDIAPTPLNPDGTVKQVANHQDWRQDLIDAYGPHCAYCNNKLPNSAEVEHEVAQALHIVDPLAWTNLVLGCKPCNLAKTNHLFTVATHYLPTHHNTHLAFSYIVIPHPILIGHFACIPTPSNNFQVGTQQFAKATRTIDHLKLNRVEQNAERTRRATDIRWKNRYEALVETETAKNLWDSLISLQQKQLFLIDLKIRVFNKGFFSLWYIAFSNVPDALEVIVNTFNRTNQASFPQAQNYQAQIRRNGDL